VCSDPEFDARLHAFYSARVLEIPTPRWTTIQAKQLRIAPPDDYAPLDNACARAGKFDWIVFSSVNAVEAFVDRLLEGPQDLRCLNGVKLFAVRPAQAQPPSARSCRTAPTGPGGTTYRR